MSTPVLVDISMLAHGLIPDDVPLAGEVGREFVLVFPEALTKMFAGSDPATAQLFNETLRAYKKTTQTKIQNSKKRAKRNGRVSEEDASAGVGDFMLLWNRLREAGESAVYRFADSADGPESSSEESEWIKHQIEDGHLRYHLRAAYNSRLGIKPDPLLDQYYLEVLAALAVGRAQSPRTRLLLASVGTATLDILAQATGVLLLDVEKNLSDTVGRMADTIQGYIERKHRFFAEIQPNEVFEQVIERGLDVCLSWFLDPTSGTLLVTGAVLSAGFFVIVDGYEAPANVLVALLKRWPWLLGLVALLLVLFGLIWLRGKICDLLCQEPDTRPLIETITPNPTPVSVDVRVPTVEIRVVVVPAPTPVPPTTIVVPCLDCRTDCYQRCGGVPHPAGFHAPQFVQPPYMPVNPGFQGSSWPYVVQSGDTIYGLARRFGVSPHAILALNYLPDPNYLQVGQVLYLPVPYHW